MQVDLSLEARHLWAFNYNFRFNRDVRFPFPIYPLVAPEVLVETFAEGDCISDYVKRGAEGEFNSRSAQETCINLFGIGQLISLTLIIVVSVPENKPLPSPQARKDGEPDNAADDAGGQPHPL